ncbi:GNAT family N-acetyltransferase [Halocynthiibacter namhaensis]|uniref:GNAT family N-acetyltransferase n=1 Tax=Halocynthiibacter namhaensis TaxID=1290553 RepID=UPI0005796626|nr:GNAT family N-acetyltransferase [Halocynthiibacter namhaensis]
MPTDLNVRRLRPADYAIWRYIRRTALKVDPAQFDETLRGFDKTSDHEFQVALEHNTIFAAYDEAIPVAIAGSYPVSAPRDGNVVHIFGVWVKPPYRGRNLAQRLIEHCIPDHAQAELLVRIDNMPAIDAYRRMGFLQANAPADAICYCATDNAPGIYMLRRAAP